MMRVRALAAVLACLAVLASGVMTVAAASVPSAQAVTDRELANAPCSNCDDCDGVPCPMPAAACLQVASHAAPTLIPSTVDLLPTDHRTILWSPGTTTLSGLSPPPDPFPPRT